MMSTVYHHMGEFDHFEVTELAYPGNYAWGANVLQLGELELNGD